MIKKETVYAVVWGSAALDGDSYTSHAFCGVTAVCDTKESAKVYLTSCKDSFIVEAMESLSFDAEDVDDATVREQLTVEGSVDQGYFTIEYEYADAPIQIRMEIVETSHFPV
jgi:hypothetical protein